MEYARRGALIILLAALIAAAAVAQGDPAGPVKQIPKKAGKWLIQGKQRKYWLQVPKSAEEGKAVPLVLNFSYNVVQNRTDEELKEWEGFEGIAATAIDNYTASMAFGMEILEEVGKVFKLEKEQVMVVSWRGRGVLDLVAPRPDLFQYGYDDSTFGNGPWPNSDRSGQRAAQFAKVHVYFKLTGVDYKQGDRGFDDAKMKQVEDFWKGLGVKDLLVERYPKSDKFPDQNLGCIGFNASARARAWFEKKLEDAKPPKRK